jgi:hypothetical protein
VVANHALRESHIARDILNWSVQQDMADECVTTTFRQLFESLTDLLELLFGKHVPFRRMRIGELCEQIWIQHPTVHRALAQPIHGKIGSDAKQISLQKTYGARFFQLQQADISLLRNIAGFLLTVQTGRQKADKRPVVLLEETTDELRAILATHFRAVGHGLAS